MGSTLRRRHEAIAHTADVGLRAEAPDLPELFEEAALALAELSAEVSEGGGAGIRSEAFVDRTAAPAEPIELEADDLAGLAYAWLNELIGRAQAGGQALAGTAVAEIEEAPEGAWRLRARARFLPYGEGDQGAVRPRHDVKSATYHGLEVRRRRGGWTLTAYLDV